jgi:hypothetical protein
MILLLLLLLFVVSNVVYSVDYSQPTITLQSLRALRNDISYDKISDAYRVYPTKSIFNEDEIYGDNGQIIIPESFIATIPYGRVCSCAGLVIVNDKYVEDFFWHGVKKGRARPFVDLLSLPEPKLVEGTVAVLSQFGANCYYHWMLELLPKLGLLQKSRIEYDYLYVPLELDYMRQTLILLGVDLLKVIEPCYEYQYIQADELVVPSDTSACRYSSAFAIHFLRTKFIPLAKEKIDSNNFSKRVFISRNENAIRRIKNEEEVFKLFEPYGFVKYELENLSILEQVALFNNAEIIVGEHGAGLTNIVFCEPGSQVVEIFQALQRLTYWHLSQELQLQHICVKTIEFFTKNIYKSCPQIHLEPIKNIINQLFLSSLNT